MSEDEKNRETKNEDSDKNTPQVGDTDTPGQPEQEIIQQLEREERQKLDSQTIENPDESDDDYFLEHLSEAQKEIELQSDDKSDDEDTPIDQVKFRLSEPEIKRMSDMIVQS